MSAIQIITLVIPCAAAAIAVASAVTAYQANQLARRARERTLPIHNGNDVITFPHRMPDAEVETFKARWQATYGESGDVCSAYRVPRTSADSGLCASCGMSDYKHQQEETSA